MTWRVPARRIACHVNTHDELTLMSKSTSHDVASNICAALLHAPKQASYIFLYSKGVAYMTDDSGCYTGALTVPIIQTRHGGC
jgi:hypothetical protein